MLAALASAAIPAASSLIGGMLSDKAAEKNAQRNIQLQKDFAQQGIQWKTEDAKKAGIHPLAALGAQTHSFAPVSVGGSGIGAGVASMGQDISRAMHATRSESGKVDAYTKTIQDLNIRRMGLENEMLTSQIAKINQAGGTPPMPTAGDRYLIDGQTQSGLVKNTPLERVVSAPGHPSQEGAAITDTGYARTQTGYHPVMSKDVKERLEEDWIGTALWNIRNRLAPTIGPSTAYHNAPPVPAADGKTWAYNPLAQEYQQYRRWPRKGKYYVYY